MFTHDLTGISVSFVKKKAITNESSKEAEQNESHAKSKLFRLNGDIICQINSKHNM